MTDPAPPTVSEQLIAAATDATATLLECARATQDPALHAKCINGTLALLSAISAAGMPRPVRRHRRKGAATAAGQS